MTEVKYTRLIVLGVALFVLLFFATVLIPTGEPQQDTPAHRSVIGEETSWMSYTDETGQNVIAYTGDLAHVERQVKDLDAVFREVTYSRMALDKTFEEVSALCGEYGIKVVALSHKDNAVIVTLERRDEIETIKSLVDCAAVLFKDMPIGTTIVAT